jgi:hypothetical protein
MRDLCSPTLKGSYHPEPRDAGPAGRRPDSTPRLRDRTLYGARIPGALALATVLIPLRESRMDSAEDVLGAQKTGKRPSDPLSLNGSTETSNSSSFWRVEFGNYAPLSF